MARNINAVNHVLKNGFERITSEYGPRTSPVTGFHNGADVVSSKTGRDDIVAIQDGVVEAIRTGVKIGDTVKSGGNYVYLKHEGGHRTQYHHLKEGSICVKKGDAVKKGQVIGYMGETGLTYGAHLHFEAWKDGSRCDPVPYLLGEKTIPATPAPAPAPVPSTGLAAGDKVSYAGRLYADSAGNGAGKTVSGVFTVFRVIEGKSHGVLLDGGLGWVSAADCVKQGAAPKPPAPQKPLTAADLKKGDKVRVKKGAKSHGGASVSSRIYEYTWILYQNVTGGDRVLLSKRVEAKGALDNIMTAFNIKDVEKV